VKGELGVDVNWFASFVVGIFISAGHVLHCLCYWFVKIFHKLRPGCLFYLLKIIKDLSVCLLSLVVSHVLFVRSGELHFLFHKLYA